MSEITLECPFNNGEHNNCDFKTHSEVEYLNHTKSHNPIILKPEEKNVKIITEAELMEMVRKTYDPFHSTETKSSSSYFASILVCKFV